MADMTRFDLDKVNVIGKLGTTVQERGLTTQQFKDKFDEGPIALGEFVNETLIPEVEAHMAENVTDDGGVHGLKIEQGTFSPTLVGTSTAGEGTYAYQIGKYYKIGKLVHIEIYLNWTAHTGTGNMEIRGLPFIVASTPSGHQITYAISLYGIALSAGNAITCFTGSSGAVIALRQYDSAGATTPVPMDTSGQIRIVGSYMTD